jgi:hypothetical protein
MAVAEVKGKIYVLPPSGLGTLHCRFLLEILNVPVNRGHRQDVAIETIAHETVAFLDVALNVDVIPFLRVPSICDWNVIMLAPEEGGVCEGLFGRSVSRRCYVRPWKRWSMCE